MTKISALIVDDEQPARERLTRLINPIQAIDLIGEADSADAALAMIAKHQPQLIFLDISMPSMSGIQLAETLRQQANTAKIIFTTAFDEYALDAFDVSASDYLLKPIRRERLLEAIKKVLPEPKEDAFIVIKDAKTTRKIALNDIIFLHADQKYTEVYLSHTSYLTSDSLKEFEQNFSGYFLRIHRSTLVNRNFLKGFEQHKSGMFVTLNDTDKTPEVSRRHQAEVRKFFSR
ncbi:LytTR family DNA-binding domain-containing protein [Kangiella sp. TOML190]|uniref:LytR/AlgR family response regulator transcription factor n=1 Tax=Kangiella sp. TOML190 TaxID=2931351 RepID=UPI00203C76E2|nr:LytTR family DNA-binding domain-containing protein [Kangiella sp. TOML190]